MNLRSSLISLNNLQSPNESRKKSNTGEETSDFDDIANKILLQSDHLQDIDYNILQLNESVGTEKLLGNPIQDQEPMHSQLQYQSNKSLEQNVVDILLKLQSDQSSISILDDELTINFEDRDSISMFEDFSNNLLISMTTSSNVIKQMVFTMIEQCMFQLSTVVFSYRYQCSQKVVYLYCLNRHYDLHETYFLKQAIAPLLVFGMDTFENIRLLVHDDLIDQFVPLDRSSLDLFTNMISHEKIDSASKLVTVVTDNLVLQENEIREMIKQVMGPREKDLLSFNYRTFNIISSSFIGGRFSFRIQEVTKEKLLFDVFVILRNDDVSFISEIREIKHEFMLEIIDYQQIQLPVNFLSGKHTPSSYDVLLLEYCDKYLYQVMEKAHRDAPSARRRLGFGFNMVRFMLEVTQFLHLEKNIESQSLQNIISPFTIACFSQSLLKLQPPRPQSRSFETLNLFYTNPNRFFGGEIGGLETDCFSIGVLLYQLTENRLPWVLSSEKEEFLVEFQQLLNCYPQNLKIESVDPIRFPLVTTAIRRWQFGEVVSIAPCDDPKVLTITYCICRGLLSLDLDYCRQAYGELCKCVDGYFKTTLSTRASQQLVEQKELNKDQDTANEDSSQK